MRKLNFWWHFRDWLHNFSLEILDSFAKFTFHGWQHFLESFCFQRLGLMWIINSVQVDSWRSSETHLSVFHEAWRSLGRLHCAHYLHSLLVSNIQRAILRFTFHHFQFVRFVRAVFGSANSTELGGLVSQMKFQNWRPIPILYKLFTLVFEICIFQIWQFDWSHLSFHFCAELGCISLYWSSWRCLYGFVHSWWRLRFETKIISSFSETWIASMVS